MSTRVFLQGAIDAGNRARVSRSSEQQILRHGKAFRVLTDNRGKMTEAGKIYQNITGEALRLGGFDPEQTPQRHGHIETIRTRSGKTKVIRKWDAAKNAFEYTNLGRRYFSEKNEYVIQIPIERHIDRVDGSRAVIRGGFMPYADIDPDKIQLEPHMTPAQVKERFHQYVLDRASVDGGVLYSVSRETFTYDESREWVVMEMSTNPTRCQSSLLAFYVAG